MECQRADCLFWSCDFSKTWISAFSFTSKNCRCVWSWWQCKQSVQWSNTTFVNNMGSWDSTVIENETCNQKVTSPSSGRNGGRIFFQYPIHPRITAVAHKISRTFCQKCKWQVTPKHIWTLPMWLGMKWRCKLNRCMFVDGSSFTWHQPYNN